MRINALKDLLFTLSNDVKKIGQEGDTLKTYVENNASNQNIEQLMSKEELGDELKNLMASNYAMEEELKEFRDKINEVKKAPAVETRNAKRDNMEEKTSPERKNLDKKLSIKTQNTTRIGRSKEPQSVGLAKA